MVEISPVSQQIWDMKYRFKGVDGQPVDKTTTTPGAALRMPWWQVKMSHHIGNKDFLMLWLISGSYRRAVSSRARDLRGT